MSTFTVAPRASFYTSNFSISDSAHSSQITPGSLFGSLKKKMQSKGSRTHGLDGARSVYEQNSAHPQSANIPATRRPTPAANSNPFVEAPPAYTPAPNAASIQPQGAILNVQPPPASQGADDPYSFLSTFDTVFLIDDSGSMAGSRWRETGNAIEAITPICTAHDADGIDLYFLNHPDSAFHHNISNSAIVREIFQTVRPRGGTPTGQRLNGILKPYMRRYAAQPDATKPLNIIVVTDGEPSDDVESPLISAAKKLDKLDAPAWQVGVQFFQVGRDEVARKHLMQLDDELAEISGDDELRDIVDTVPFTGAQGGELTGDGILKVVLGAVNRRLDRKKSKDLHR